MNFFHAGKVYMNLLLEDVQVPNPKAPHKAPHNNMLIAYMHFPCLLTVFFFLVSKDKIIVVVVISFLSVPA